MKSVRPSFIREFTVRAIENSNALVALSLDGEEFVLIAQDAVAFGHQLVTAAGAALELQKPALEKQGWVLNPGS
jgi:hypothetical protein